MDLKKLPPSMVLMLGLACGDKETLGPCLSPATTDDTGPSPTVGPCLDVDPTVSSVGETETGPCLSTTGWEQTSTGTTGSTGADSTIGPCLSPEPPTGTGTETDTGTGTGGDTDTDGTTGMMGAEPSDSRAAALERVLSRNVLPADVAARLRGGRREP